MKKDYSSAPAFVDFVFVAEAVPQTEGDKLVERGNILLLHKLLAPMRSIGKFRTNRNVRYEVV